MKQYCRYCSWCVNGNAYYCGCHDELLKRVDKATQCKDFVLSELGDVDTGRQYTPRPRIKDDRQIKFNLEVDNGKRTDR